MLVSAGWQNITTLLVAVAIVIGATVIRNARRRRHFSVDADVPPARRPGIDWDRLRLWHVVLVVVFVFSLVVIVTTKNSDNRQGAWGLLGLVVGAVLPKGT